MKQSCSITALLFVLCAALLTGCYRDIFNSLPTGVSIDSPSGAVVSTQDKLQIDVFSNGIKAFYFYCNTEDGEVRMRSVPSDNAIYPDSNANIEKMLEEYRRLPEGDSMKIGGGFSQYMVHLGHERSHKIGFGDVWFHIVGDGDTLEDHPADPDVDFIYHPCATTAHKRLDENGDYIKNSDTKDRSHKDRQDSKQKGLLID